MDEIRSLRADVRRLLPPLRADTLQQELRVPPQWLGVDERQRRYIAGLETEMRRDADPHSP